MNDLITYLEEAGNYRLAFPDFLAVRIDDYAQLDVNVGCCGLTVAGYDNSEPFSLVLQPVPLDEEAIAYMNCLDVEFATSSMWGLSAKIRLGNSDVDVIQRLTNEMRRIAGGAQELPFPNWKSVCFRTVNSLERFAELLAGFNQIEIELIETAAKKIEQQSALTEDVQF